jgi:hypothetical protein
MVERAQPSAWMVSPAVDLAIFVGVTAATLVPWVASDLLHVEGYWILAFVALANGPHLISTWTRVYLPRRERFRRPLHYWVMPGLMAAFAVGCFVAGGRGPQLVRTVIFYWASWHFASQSWGVLRIYQRKHGAVGTRAAQLERALVYLPALFCVMRRVYTGPWGLFGVEILHPHLRAWMVNTVGGVTVALSALYLVLCAPQWIKHWVRPVYLVSSAFGFIMPYLVIKNGTSAFAAAALWHAIQYIGIVWLYNRRRYAGAIDPDAHVISYVSQPGRSIHYVALIALCALTVYALALVVTLVAKVPFQSFALTLWTALTLGHYYLDGVIWKFKQYPLAINTVVGGAHVQEGLADSRGAA